MEIIPAIDIIGGQCVRLTQGDYSRMTVYAKNPLDVALQFCDAGIRRLHLVDLDGAKAGHIINYKTIELIAGRTPLVIDFGGGLNSHDDLRIAFSSGAQMVTGGSIAVRQPETFRQWLKDNPNKSYYPGGVKLKGRMKDYWSEYQYSQIYVQGNILTDWAVMPSAEFYQYRYTESWPSMQWTLGTDEQTICGYQCQKATCHWRGRDYEAWFTSAIPMKSGPWKFGGLPGLIMKIYDTKHLYTWEAVSVENGSFPILQLDERKFKNSERKKVLKMQRDWNVKYGELAGVMRVGSNTPVTTRYPFDQLELE